MTSRYVITSTLRLTRPSSTFPLSRAFHKSRSLSSSEVTTNQVARTRKNLLIEAPIYTIKFNAKLCPVEESKDTKDDDDLSERVRRLMRPVPHALTVITSFQPGENPEDEPEPRGLLVSSFNTVTLFPRPYVSFNIKLPSSTWDAIEASGHFTASGIDHPATASAFTIGQASNEGKATSGGWTRDWVSKDGKLRDHRVAYWWMQCRWTTKQSLLVEDHLIAVGEVLQAGAYWNGMARILESPLLYANGGYCRLERPGRAITQKEPVKEDYHSEQVLNHRKF